MWLFFDNKLSIHFGKDKTKSTLSLYQKQKDKNWNIKMVCMVDIKLFFLWTDFVTSW